MISERNPDIQEVKKATEIENKQVNTKECAFFLLITTININRIK